MLIKALLASFKENEDSILFVANNKEYTYGAFLSLVKRLASYFGKFDRKEFNLKLMDKIEFFAVYLAIIFTNNVAVFYDDENIVDSYEVIDDSKYYLIENKYDIEDKLSKRIDEDLVSTIIFTSGTTKNKKGVMLSNNNLYFSLIGGMSILSSSKELTFFSVLPITHIFGLISDFLLPILSGSMVFVNLYKEFLFEEIKKYQPTNMNLTPSLLEKIFIYFKKNDEIDQLKLKRVLVGGAPIHEALAKEALSYNIELYNGYGSTETSGCIAINKITDCKKINNLKIIETTQVCIEEKGRIVVSGKNVMKGYYPNLLEAPVFLSSDLGKIVEDTLILDGRIDSLIVLSSGFKIYPEKIESVVNSFENVNGSLLYLENNKCILKIDSKEKLTYEQRNKIPFSSYIDEIIYDNLEYTNTLKVKRNTSNDSIFSEVQAIFKKYFDDEIKLDSNLKLDLSISSLDLFMIFTNIEEKYNKKFSSEDINKMETVEDIIRAIKNNNKIKFLIGLPFVSDINEWSKFLDSYKDYIESVYFSIPLGKNFHSRKSVMNYLEKKENVEKYYKLLSIANEKKVNLELVLNTYQLNDKDIINAKNELERRQIIINSITTMDCYYDIVKNHFNDVKINYSFNNFLNDINELKMNAYDGVIIGRYQIRYIELMKRIKTEIKATPIVLLNNGCNYFCGWCHSLAHCGEAFGSVKNKYSKEYLYALFSIMPSELKYYLDIGINTFKISSRNDNLEYLKKALDSYIKQNEKEYIIQDKDNYLLWSRLKWLMNHFNDFDYDKIMDYKRKIWEDKMPDYKRLQYKNDLMFNKGIILDLSDKYTVLDVPFNKFYNINLKMFHPYKTHIKGIIYGSSTCSKFIDAISLEELLHKFMAAKEKGLETYFITPNIKEDYFLYYKTLIDKLIDSHLIDYLISNDYGIIELYHSKIPMVMGRLFDKRIRDFRVPHDTNKRDLGIISGEFLDYYKAHSIKRITIEPLDDAKYDYPSCIEKIYMNYPYIIESSGNICEYSGINKENQFKFKNNKCDFSCLKYSAHLKYKNTIVYKYMNAIYYSSKVNKNMLDLFFDDKFELIVKYFEV